MTWLTPMLGVVAAAIAVPSLLILYFLKLRRRDVEISTTLLWRKAIEDLQANAPFQRLRRNILLLLQLLALGAVLLALAQPQWQGSSTVGDKHIILIDRSASMSARDETAGGEPATRLEAAKRQAIQFVESLRGPGPFDRAGGDEAMVIAFDVAAEVRQTFTSDKRALRAAIEAIEPTDTPTSIAQAFELARAQAPRREFRDETTGQVYERPPGSVGTLHVWSDGRVRDADAEALARDDTVLYHAVGKPDAVNIGVTMLRGSRAFDDPNRLSIFAGLSSTDTRPRTVGVELAIDGTVAAIKNVDIPAAAPPAPVAGDSTPAPPEPAAGGVVFTLDRPQGGIVTVRLVPPATGTIGADVLPTDDVAWLVAPPAKRLSVAVVTTGSLFLTEALQALPLAKLEVLSPDQFSGVLTRSRGRSTGYDVVVLDGWVPPGEPGGDGSLPPGRFLIVGAVPPPPLGALPVEAGRGSPAVIVDWRRAHPVLRSITLDGVQIARSRPIEVPEGSAAKVIASASTGPAIIEMSSATTRALAVTFDVAESTWPFDPSFIVFLATALSYLGDDTEGVGQAVATGGNLSDRIPGDAASVELREPGGARSPQFPTTDGSITYGPVRRQGVYQLSWEGTPGPTDARVGGRSVRPYAANLLSAEETEVRTAPNIVTSTAVVRAEDRGEERVARRVWPWLILGALGVLMLEWFIYNRKVQI